MPAVADQWRPDVILRETAEFASYVVADGTGIPHIQVAMSLAAVEAFMHAVSTSRSTRWAHRVALRASSLRHP
jgi:hypothetical protein